MIVILIILAAAAVGAGLARWRRLPLVPLLILSGIGIAALDLTLDRALCKTRCCWDWPSWFSALARK
jgi:hypothetical protein